MVKDFCIGDKFNYFVKDHVYMQNELDKAFNDADDKEDPQEVTRDELYTFTGRNVLMYRAFNIHNIKSGCQ